MDTRTEVDTRMEVMATVAMATLAMTTMMNLFGHSRREIMAIDLFTCKYTTLKYSQYGTEQITRKS